LTRRTRNLTRRCLANDTREHSFRVKPSCTFTSSQPQHNLAEKPNIAFEQGGGMMQCGHIAWDGGGRADAPSCFPGRASCSFISQAEPLDCEFHHNRVAEGFVKMADNFRDDGSRAICCKLAKFALRPNPAESILRNVFGWNVCG